jgi:hypothetical protein
MTWRELCEAVADAELRHGLSFDDYEVVLDDGYGWMDAALDARIETRALVLS